MPKYVYDVRRVIKHVEIVMDKSIDYDEENPVPGYKGYTCTRKGEISSYRRGAKRILVSHDNNGYDYVTMKNDEGQICSIGVHVVVALTYIPNPDPEGLPFVNHIDQVKSNRFVHNLEWITHPNNVKKSFEEGFGTTTARRVVNATLDGKMIAEYESITIASHETKVPVPMICNICRGYKLKYKGVTWYYAEDFIGQSVAPKKTRATIVTQYDKKYNKIAEYKGLYVVRKKFHVDSDDIIKAAKNRTLFKGFYWRCKKYKPSKKVTVEEKEAKRWKKLPEFPCYKISKDGRIYTERFKRFLKPTINSGFYTVKIKNKNRKMKTMKIHKLVALAYISNPNEYKIVRHKNGNKLDNRIENLEWCTLKMLSAYTAETRRKIGRKVCLLSDDGSTVIEIYDSVTEAVKQSCISKSTMRSILKNDIKRDGENYAYMA